jgi:PII-like signaling protein
MAAEFIKLKQLNIFVGEDFFCGDRPFYKVMLDVAAKYKLAGCTVFRGLQGYGSRVRGRERRMLISVSDAINLPVIITIIDTEAQIERVIPFLQENLTHGVAIIDDVNMLATDFVKKRFNKAVEERENPALQE